MNYLVSNLTHKQLSETKPGFTDNMIPSKKVEADRYCKQALQIFGSTLLPIILYKGETIPIRSL